MSNSIASHGHSAIPTTGDRHTTHDTPRVVFGRRAFTVLAWVFTVAIAVQVLMAGMAIFIGPTWWTNHRNFVHVFEFVPLLMLVAAFMGQMPARAKWLSLLAFGLIAVQYALVILGMYWLPVVAALHPVNALFIFGLALRLATGRTTTT